MTVPALRQSDLVIADLATENAALHERVSELEHEWFWYRALSQAAIEEIRSRDIRIAALGRTNSRLRVELRAQREAA
jgi:hypothetical protein